AVLLAGFDDGLANEYLATAALTPLTPNSVTDRAALRQKIDQVRVEGFAKAFEQTEVGVNALAVPVRDQSGAIDAALVVSGPAVRYDDAAMDRTLGAALAAAAEISRERGWDEASAAAAP